MAVNDLGDAKTMAHLLKYDSVLGPLDGERRGRRRRHPRRRDRAQAPERARSGRAPLGGARRRRRARVDRALHEARAGAAAPRRRRAKVVISAPATDPDVTLVLGVNDDAYDPEQHRIVSNASCTTNCVAPLAKVLHDTWGIESGFMTTIHAYTNDQQILDLPHKDLRRARAAAINLIPTSTGAAKAIGVVIPELKGKVDGVSVRAPVPDGSLTDFVVQLGAEVTADEVNARFREVADTGALRGDPPLLGRAARVVRHRRQLLLVHLRQPADDGARHERQGLRLVRQRVGLQLPARRPRPAAL